MSLSAGRPIYLLGEEATGKVIVEVVRSHLRVYMMGSFRTGPARGYAELRQSVGKA